MTVLPDEQDNALEIFLTTGRTYLLAFDTRQVFQSQFQLLLVFMKFFVETIDLLILLPMFCVTLTRIHSSLVCNLLLMRT